MQKEELSREISNHLNTLRDFGRLYNQLIDSLGKTVNADTTYSVLDDTRDVLSSMKLTRESLDKVRQALKARGEARLKGK